MEEISESVLMFYAQQELREEAEASYQPDQQTERRYCRICGNLLTHASISYDEGMHVDSCE